MAYVEIEVELNDFGTQELIDEISHRRGEISVQRGFAEAVARKLADAGLIRDDINTIWRVADIIHDADVITGLIDKPAAPGLLVTTT